MNWKSYMLTAALLALAGATAQPVSAQFPHYRPISSTYLPLDHWAYPALERLAALGYADTAMVGMKPWARSECARLTEEAGEAIRRVFVDDRTVDEDVAELHASLEREFLSELEALGGGPVRSLGIESIYARAMSISGPALTDGFHFGQTVSYDFGRPFRRGLNTIAGGAGHAGMGPIALYIRGEYQHAPAAPALPDAALDVVAARDRIPRPDSSPWERIDRAALLDAYLTLQVNYWQVSAGKQSLSWGAGPDGGLLMSQ